MQVTPYVELRRKYIEQRNCQGVNSFVNREENRVYELDEAGNRLGGISWSLDLEAHEADLLNEQLAQDFVDVISAFVLEYYNCLKTGTSRYYYDSRFLTGALEDIQSLRLEVSLNYLDNQDVILMQLDAQIQEIENLIPTQNQWEKDQLHKDYLKEKSQLDFSSDKTALIDSLLMTYSKADSVLSGSTIEVVSINDPESNAPASTDGKTIAFNKAHIHDLTDLSNERLTELNGLNYHELSHVLFSPRKGAEICKWAKLNNLFAPLQLLEDIRIEMMMIKKYPSTKPFFEVTISKYLLDNLALNERSLARVYGAKYLSLDVRQQIVDTIKQLVSQESITDLVDIVNKYQRIVYPKHTTEAKDLVTRFSKYFDSDQLKQQNQMGCQDVSNMKHGASESQSKQEQLTSNPDTDKIDMSKSNNNTDSQVDNKTDSDTIPEQTNSPSQELEQRINNREAIKHTIKEYISNLNDSKVVQAKNKELRKAVTGESDYDNNLKQAPYSEYNPQETYRLMAHKFGNELEKIRTDLDPMWIQGTPSGRLNIQRAMKRDINSLDTLFDRWHEGSDACDIEAVILIDNSSSMSYQMSETCQSAWVIKRGIERINGDVTILSFNDKSYKVYDKESKANTKYRNINPKGSTNPSESLEVAIQIFKKSRKQTKLLFIVTDGAWDNETKCNARVEMCNELGVITSLVYLNDYYSPQEFSKHLNSMPAHKFNASIKHNCKYFNVIAKPNDLSKVAVDIVKIKLREGIAR